MGRAAAGGTAAAAFRCLDQFHPIVSTVDNFDSLLIPPSHPSRLPSDTFYMPHSDPSCCSHVLRTQMTAHQADLLRGLAAAAAAAPPGRTAELPTQRGVIWSGEVVRRDEIDAMHYPIFHQQDGVLLFTDSHVRALLQTEFKRKRRVGGEGCYYHSHLFGTEEERPSASFDNPHRENVVVRHLQRTLEDLMRFLFTCAGQRDIEVSWDYKNAYFPFTSPSLELYVKAPNNNTWIEMVGCGQIHQKIIQATQPIFASPPDSSAAEEPDAAPAAASSSSLSSSSPCVYLYYTCGWAFGIGLDRLAMSLCSIPDIRYLWTTDPRFRRQFNTGTLRTFRPYSNCPPVFKDISFFVPSPDDDDDDDFQATAFFDICREEAGDLLESVEHTDVYQLPDGRVSWTYRLTYRALDHNLRNDYVNKLQYKIIHACQVRLHLKVR